MAGNRVSVPEVKEILDTDLTVPQVTAFIDAANATITAWFGTTSGLTAVQLKEIERWLSAHFIACTRDHQPQEEVVGRAEIVYQGKTDMGLNATYYGQQVLLLDTTGTLGKKAAWVYAIPSFED